MLVVALVRAGCAGGDLRCTAHRRRRRGGRPRPSSWRANTLVRIDPTTNAVTEVDRRRPGARGHRRGRAQRLGLQPGRQHRLRGSTRSPTRFATRPPLPPCRSVSAPLTGPMLAADDDGAWLAGYDIGSARSLLTRIRSGGRGKREYVLGGQVQAVVVAGGAAWALVHRGERALVLRIDRRTGVATRQVRLPPDAGREELHRRARRRRWCRVGNGVAFGDPAPRRPRVRRGSVGRSRGVRDAADPRLRLDLGLRVDYGRRLDAASRSAHAPEQSLAERIAGRGGPLRRGPRLPVAARASERRYGRCASTLAQGDPAGIIRVLPAGAAGKDLIVTSIAAGTDSVWAAVGRD